MEELNKHEENNLALLIALILNQAKWLVRASIVLGILELASLVPCLDGIVLDVLLTVMAWYTVGTVVVICVSAVLAYYYVVGCERNNLERYSRKKAGK